MGACPGGDRRLRSLVLPLYAPSVLFAVGQGAVLPVIAVAARQDGASIPLAGAIVGVRGVGAVVGDLPSGALVQRFGDRRVVAVATALQVACGVAAAVSGSLLVLAVAVFGIGVGWSAWNVARLTYATEVMPPERRGQGIAALGGSSRVGNFLGPLLGAAGIQAIGTPAAFWILAGSAALGAGLVLASIPGRVGRPAGAPDGGWLRGAVTAQGTRLLAPGAMALAIGALRASRQALLPLWAAHIGVGAAGVSLVFGVSSGLDMLLFAPAGWASDRWGRKPLALACLAVLAVGHLAVPLTTGLVSLMAVGLVLGLGNGLGSGIVMTIGADLAPLTGRAAFLGFWRFVADVGTASGPFLVSAAVAAVALGPAAVVVGAAGLGVAALVGSRMPEPRAALAVPEAGQGDG